MCAEAVWAVARAFRHVAGTGYDADRGRLASVATLGSIRHWTLVLPSANSTTDFSHLDFLVGLNLHSNKIRADTPKRFAGAASVVCSTHMEMSMSDDKTKVGGQDRTRINTSQDYEVEDWAKKFGVSADQLKAAVRAVGSNAKDVEAHLKGQKAK